MINTNKQDDIKLAYQSRLETYQQQASELNRRVKQIGFMRLLIAISTVILIYLSYKDNLFIAICVGLAGGVVFLLMVFRHLKLKKEKERINHLIEINQQSLARLSGNWRDFRDTGGEYCDEEHPYSSDLDIFGDYSLFQYINVAHSWLGRKAMQSILNSNERSFDEISNRQKATDELAMEIDWRQNYQAWGETLRYSNENPSHVIEWANSINQHPAWGWLSSIRLLPFVSTTVLLVTLIWSLPIFIPLALYLMQIFIFAYTAKNNFKEISLFSKQLESLGFYVEALRCIEEKTFTASFLTTLQESLNSSGVKSASSRLEKLAMLVEYSNARFIPQIHIFLNILFLWDVQCVIGLRKWKEVNGNKLEPWLNTIAQFEVLSSFAILRFDHPDWAYPTVSHDGPSFSSKNLGHPLILDNERRGNDVVLHPDSGTTIVTGSNMSGKSTLLRTIGVNLVMAYAGAPVCADKLNCRKMDIFTSMRIRDDLGKSISTFYGELLKIKRIIETISSSKDTVLVIIDEIFRGTNSRDRYEGAIAVIKALCNANVVALISTHDLALCDMEKSFKEKINNVHFSETFSNTGMEFDYILKPGMSNTSNAGHLMRLIGLDVSTTINTVDSTIRQNKNTIGEADG